MKKYEFICHNNRRLKHIYTSKRKKDSGYEAKSRVYECESCDNCEFRLQCFKGKKNQRIFYSSIFIKYREESQRNIDSELGMLFRVNRSIQTERAIGALKQDYKFNRFKYRGEIGTFFEVLIYAMAFSVNKLHNKIQDNRLGLSFFYPKASNVA
jgi:hypothetical protein